MQTLEMLNTNTNTNYGYNKLQCIFRASVHFNDA